MIPILIVLIAACLISFGWYLRHKKSQVSPVDPKLVLAKCPSVKQQITQFTSIRGVLNLTEDEVIFVVDLGLVSMSYDNSQIRRWTRSALRIQIVDGTTIAIADGVEETLFHNVSPEFSRLI